MPGFGILLKTIISGMYLVGSTVREITADVFKPHGASPTEIAVRGTIAFVAAFTWRVGFLLEARLIL